MSTLRMFACLSILLVAGAPAAAAQSLEKVDAANGERLVRKLCVNCHQVAPDSGDPVLADVPGFREVANRPGMTREAIETFVLNPHPPMPQVQLTRDELSDISAYIMSLRGE